MRQTLFMIVVTAVGALGAFAHGPQIAIAVYYFFAALRPQAMWAWALPQGVAWSQYVALAAILALISDKMGLLGRRSEASLPQSTAFKLLIAFAIWICLTYLTAQNRDAAWPWLLEYLKIFTMVIVAVLTLRTVSHVWWVYTLVTTALIYISYEINALYVFDGRLDVYHTGYGGLDNNGAGLMIAMGVPLAIYAWEGTTGWWRWAYIAGVPLMVHAVLMTYSRGAMLSLLVAVPLIVVRSRRRWQFAAFAVAMAMMVPVMAGDEIRRRFSTIGEYETDGSANSRFDSWAAAVAMANDHPFFGVGIRNANLYSHRYGADMEGRTIHSQYLQTLADSGYPALLLYLGTLFLLLAGLRRIRKTLVGSGEDHSRMLAMASGVECSIVVFMVGGVFLSLEVFELPYALLVIGCQLLALHRGGLLPVTTVERQQARKVQYRPNVAVARRRMLEQGQTGGSGNPR